MKHQFLYMLFFLMGSFSLFSQEVSVGAGSYNLTPPTIGGTTGKVLSNSAGSNEYPKVTAAFNQPIQTNDWWTSLLYKYYNNSTFLWEIHSWKLYAHPLAFVANRYGLDVVFPTSLTVSDFYGVTGGKYQYPVNVQDFTIGIKDLDLGVTDTVKVDEYGDWHVKAEWNDGTKSLQTTMAHGSPYVFVEKQNTDSVYLRFFYAPIIHHNLGNVLGITINGHHYGLFAPTGATWETSESYTHDENNFVANPSNLISRNAFKSNLDGKDYFSIALLPDNSLATLNDYAQYAFAFIDDTQASWSYDENGAILTSTFTVTTEIKEGTESGTLQALYPHQWKNMSSINTTYTYSPTARGTMKVHRGNTFSTELRNQGILPALPLALNAADQTELYQFIEDEYAASNTYITSEDTYWQGKRFGRQADLVYLADQVGHTMARDKFIADLKSELEDWFTAPTGENNRGYFYYDDNWDSMLGYPASFGAETQLNDHHFHYGYFVKAAATIAQFDPTWASQSQWGGMMELLIKDVNNWDRSDTQFPFLRYFDAYAGHSWANGHGNFHWGNDQESSSESINFAAWTYLYGLHTQQNDIKNLGIYLYLNEAETARQYWMNEDSDNFPGSYNYQTAARIWGNGADKVSGGQPFEMESEYQLGINTFPINAPLLYLAKNQAAVATNHTEASNLDDGIGDLWEDIMWGYQAMNDPVTALADYDAHTSTSHYNTNAPWLPNVTGIYEDFSDLSLAPAQIYHWLHALDSLGQPNFNVTANDPSAMLFQNGADLLYVVHNPESSPKTVTFSNGQSVTAPANKISIFNPTLPVELVDFNARKSGNEVALEWIVAAETNTSHYELEHAQDGHSFQRIESVDAIYPLGGTYTYHDHFPIRGLNYYRLKMIDWDGSYEYSKIIPINMGSHPNITYYPNPLGSDRMLNIVSSSSHSLELRIYDLDGQVLMKTIIQERTQVDISDWSSGTYYLQYLWNGQMNTEKLILLD